jgi:hypothetical protein
VIVGRRVEPCRSSAGVGYLAPVIHERRGSIFVLAVVVLAGVVAEGGHGAAADPKRDEREVLMVVLDHDATLT